MQKKRQVLDYGFTLVETLIVLVVIVVSSFVIVNSIKSGMSIFKKARDIKSIEDISVFFDRFRGDLKNVIIFSQLEFKGDHRSVAFPIIGIRPFKDELSGKITQDIDQIRYVKYSFSQSKNSVYRQEFDYSQYLQKKEVPPKNVLSKVSDFKIEYLTKSDDGLKKDFSTKQGRIPCFINLTIGYDLDFGENKNSYFSEQMEIPIAKSESVF